MNIIKLLVILFINNSCNSQSCNELPTHFNSYQQAVSEVKSTDFTIEDSVNTSRSSLIKSASFYSCDSNVGFLLVKIKSTEYIYENVPISVWDNFKQVESFGKFYNSNIKERYQINFY